VQLPHSDYDPVMAPDNSPFGMLIALQNGTRLKIWTGSCRCWVDGNDGWPTLDLTAPDQFESRMVTLQKGQVLVFRGDLIHAGAAYESRNVRVHCFLDVPDLTRVKRKTYPLHKYSESVQARFLDTRKLSVKE
jgi:ectoine hydroxylase-related dioxygenase (phytanoyl-CoA dioxygenase family)